jgi:putative hydrolase
LFDRLGARFLEQLTTQPDESEPLQQMQMVMKQVGPLLMGLQTGTLVGHLAKEVLSGSDPSIPRDGETEVIVVLPNVERLAGDYGLDLDSVIRWIAVQETARQLVVQGVAWVGPYRRNLMTELIDAVEIDADALERRLVDLQTGGLEALEQGVPVDNSIPLVSTPRHEAALARVRAFVGLHEGYAARATAAVGEGMLGDATKIDEVMARYRATSSDAKDLLANVLGFSLDRDLVATGETFCAAIEKLEGPGELNRVWDAPDNLPTYSELRDPFLWIDRVLKQK